MKCQICNENEADVIVGLNNGTEENNVYICHNCLSKLGFDLRESMVKGMLALLGKNIPSNNVTCPSCGRTMAEYIKTGRYGCKECHKFFDDYLLKDNERKNNDMNDKVNGALEQDKKNRELLEQFFNNDNFSSTYKNIFTTKKLLLDAIQKENYEEAARLRDRLNKINND